MSDADVTNTVAASVVALSVGGTGNTSIIRPAGLTDAVLKEMLSVDLGNVIDNVSTTGDIHWAFNSDQQAFDFLATGETLELTYTIRATDSDASPAFDDQTVVIKITGTNDRRSTRSRPRKAPMRIPPWRSPGSPSRILTAHP